MAVTPWKPGGWEWGHILSHRDKGVASHTALHNREDIKASCWLPYRLIRLETLGRSLQELCCRDCSVISVLLIRGLDIQYLQNSLWHFSGSFSFLLACMPMSLLHATFPLVCRLLLHLSTKEDRSASIHLLVCSCAVDRFSCLSEGVWFISCALTDGPANRMWAETKYLNSFCQGRFAAADLLFVFLCRVSKQCWSDSLFL